MTTPTNDDDGNYTLDDIADDGTRVDHSAIFLSSYRDAEVFHDPYTNRVTEVVSQRPGMTRLRHESTLRYRERSQEDATWRSTATSKSVITKPRRK